MIPGWFRSICAALAAFGLLVLRFFQKKDANEIPNAVNQARQDAISGDDTALNADLAAARDRLRNPKNLSNKP